MACLKKLCCVSQHQFTTKCDSGIDTIQNCKALSPNCTAILPRTCPQKSSKSSRALFIKQTRLPTQLPLKHKRKHLAKPMAMLL